MLKKHNMVPLHSVRFQAYFRTHKPPVLIMWGKYDIYFSVKEAYCYKRDLPNAGMPILNEASINNVTSTSSMQPVVVPVQAGGI